MSNRAFTLAETMVASGLLVLISFSGVWMLRAANSIFQTSTERTRWSRDFAQFGLWLTDLLEEAPPASLHLLQAGSNTAGVAFPTARDEDGGFHTNATGLPELQAYQVLTFGTGQLGCGRAPLNSQGLPSPATSRCLFRGLQSFQVQLVGQTLSVQLSANNLDGSLSAAWEKRIYPR